VDQPARKNIQGKPVAVINRRHLKVAGRWSQHQTSRTARYSTPDRCRSARGGVSAARSAQKFASEGFFTVLTTRTASNAAALAAAIQQQGGASMIVELDLAVREINRSGLHHHSRRGREPDVLIYNAGYLEGRDLPPAKDCSSIFRSRC